MSNENDPHVFHMLHIAHAELFRAADRLMKAQEGIATAHQVILFTLAAENGLASAEVARRCGHSKSRLTNLVDTLEAKSLVERRHADADKRIQNLFITPKGRALVKRVSSMTRRLNAQLLEPFSESERDAIRSFLAHVVKEAASI